VLQRLLLRALVRDQHILAGVLRERGRAGKRQQTVCDVVPATRSNNLRDRGCIKVNKELLRLSFFSYNIEPANVFPITQTTPVMIERMVLGSYNLANPTTRRIATCTAPSNTRVYDRDD
jgi:hypothetical protein